MSRVEFGEPIEGSIRVRVNGVNCGNLDMGEDGFWQWYPAMRPGYIPSWMLRQIAGKVDGLNAAWEAELKEAFN